MVNLGGHGVHLHCEGDGPATVLLLHGTPRFSFHFALIWPKVAEFARVCVYDRAGDAWSEPVPGQPTAEIFVEELDRVVRHISPQRPVVLAGHSVGGVLARAYYARYPARVAAMVLIDTAPLLPAFVEATDETLRELAKKPRPPAPKAALAPPFDRLPTGFHEAHLWATDKWQAYAAGVDRFQALKYQADLYKLAAKATGSTLPVWFLIRAEQDIGAPWPNAKLVRVAASSHDIQLDQPDAVVGAIREAVRSAAADGK
jgi:pimeloyl-ACP methyl ester carboxylesterase